MKSYYQIKKCLLVFLVGLFVTHATAQQNFEQDYVLLEPQAPIPASILTSTIAKTQKDIKQYEKKKTKKSKKEFHLETNYFIDNLLTSPYLLFNTPLNATIDKIAAKLLADDPQLLEDLTFYVVKTSTVNAFATDRGDIFITMGLLARVKTEAELAFIIAHELVHYREKHSMEAYTKKEELQKKRRFGSKSPVDDFLKQSHYSQEREKEADKEGFKLFAKAGYNLNQADNAFTILEMSHTQVFNTPITKDFFERDYISIPTGKWLAKVDDLAVPEEKEDEEEEEQFRTHPDIKSRKDQLDEDRTYFSIENRSNYVASSKEEFDNISTSAQMEIAEILLLEQQYAAAAYHCFAMLQQYPNNSYLHKKLAYALYGSAQYVLTEKDQVEYEDFVHQGEWNRVHNLFKELTPKEMASMAAVYCWEQHLAHPEDKQLKKIVQDLLEDIVIYSVEDPLHYYAKAPIDTAVLNNTKSFARFSFANYMSDENFTKHLEKGIKYRADKEKRDKKEEEKSDTQKRREKKKKKINGVKVGADKVVLTNPLYIEGDIRQKRSGISAKIDYEKHDHNQDVLRKGIKKATSLTHLDVETLDIRNLKKDNNIDKLQDIHIIENWTGQFFSHPFYMVATNDNTVQGLAKKYDTPYFSSMAVVAISSRTIMQNYTAALLIIPYYVSPHYTLYRLFSNKQNTYFYYHTIDVNRYNLVLDDEHFMDIRNKDAVITNLIYGAFTQLKAKKETKK